jgi:hypothetical protein
MSYYTYIKQELSKLERQQQMVYAAACTERVAPVVRRLGLLQTVQTFNLGLDTLWKICLKQTPQRDVVELKTAVEQLPEASEDDSHLLSYRVMHGLSILAYSLDVILSENPLQASIWVCGGMMNVMGGFDFIRDNPEGAIVMIRKDTVQEEGRLEMLEIEAQKDSIALLTNVKELTSDVIETLQQSAQKNAQLIEIALFDIAPRIGWRINN